MPVGPISFTARGEGTWTPARRELSSLRGELVSGATRVLLTGELAWPKGGYRVDVGAELPSSRCSAVASTVPSGLLDELADIRLGGDVKAKLDVHVDSDDLDATSSLRHQGPVQVRGAARANEPRRFEKAFTHRALGPTERFRDDDGPGTPGCTDRAISPFMIQAVVAHEDGAFQHRGFAESEIGAALARNLKARAFKFGASTITMQLVKNVFLQRDKLLSRKVQEALIVWWLEQQVDKKWILELYMNVIEYGTGVYGIRNASLHYFGVLPDKLTPAQAAFLATILPSPKSYDEQFERGTLSESTRKKVASFLQHMRSRERIDEEALAFGLEELAASTSTTQISRRPYRSHAGRRAAAAAARSNDRPAAGRARADQHSGRLMSAHARATAPDTERADERRAWSNLPGMQPRFVVLEGIDGAGTTTQTARLAARLRGTGAVVHETREPTDGAIGALLRRILTGEVAQAEASDVVRAAQLGLLFAADRLEHVGREILPALADGAWVISDRYDHSSVAYQSVASEGAVDVAWLRGLNRFARRPDLTIVLDVAPDVARARRLARGGARELFDDDALQRKLATFYAELELHGEGEPIVHVAADGSQDEVSGRVRRARASLLSACVRVEIRRVNPRCGIRDAAPMARGEPPARLGEDVVAAAQLHGLLPTRRMRTARRRSERSCSESARLAIPARPLRNARWEPAPRRGGRRTRAVRSARSQCL